MKTFIYTTEEKTSYTHFNVYRIKRNKPIFVGSGKYQQGASKGEKSAVFKVLNNAGEVTDKLYSEKGGYYHWQMAEEDGIKIEKIK